MQYSFLILVVCMFIEQGPAFASLQTDSNQNRKFDPPSERILLQALRAIRTEENMISSQHGDRWVKTRLRSLKKSEILTRKALEHIQDSKSLVPSDVITKTVTQFAQEEADAEERQSSASSIPRSSNLTPSPPQMNPDKERTLQPNTHQDHINSAL